MQMKWRWSLQAIVTSNTDELTSWQIGERRAIDLFFTHPEPAAPIPLRGGNCGDCHGGNLTTLNTFHNNGLDEVITDRGLGAVTGDPREFGLFRTPSLRNLAFTAPYMHDGRFETLDEVIDHYSEGLVFSETIDPLMKAVDQGGVQLSNQDKADLKAFLLSLSDPEFIIPPPNPNTGN